MTEHLNNEPDFYILYLSGGTLSFFFFFGGGDANYGTLYGVEYIIYTIRNNIMVNA